MCKILCPLVVILAVLFSACKKNGNDLSKAPTQFNIEPNSISTYSGIYLTGATVNFRNTSDSAKSYQWRFGDGATATGYHASHVYSMPGTYTVSLIAYNGNTVIDSGNSKVQIVALPKLYRKEAQYDSHPFWIANYGDKIYLAGWQATINDFYAIKEWFIIQYDTLWRQQWIKTFLPSDGALQKMNLTANGDILVPQAKYANNGNWSSKLFRLDASGNIKWTWSNTSDSMSIHMAAEDKNGNILVLATKTYPDPFITAYTNDVAIQLDASGNEKWRYAFPGQHTMEHCSRLVTLNDGYIIAGNKSGPCTLTCDSANIAKLSLDGKLTWNTVIPWASGSTTGWDVFTLQDQSNQIQVVSSRSSSYYTFDLNGKFLGSHGFGMSIDPSDALINKNGSLLVLGDFWSSSIRQTRLLEVKPGGTAGWTFDVYKSMLDWNFVQYPRDTWSLSMTLTNDNVALIAGRLTYYNPSTQTNCIFLTRVNGSGKLY